MGIGLAGSRKAAKLSSASATRNPRSRPPPADDRCSLAGFLATA